MRRYFPYTILYHVILVLILSAACSKKQPGNQEIFSRYEGKKGVYIMKIPPALMVTLAGSDEKVSENLDSAGQIDMVKVMVYNRPENEGKTAGETGDEVRAMAHDFGYDLMMSMAGAKTDVSVFMLERGETISDLLVLAREGETLTLIGLSGKLNAEAIMNLISQSDLNSIDSGLFGIR
ncbi:MAG: DUF4252 domain-containing protein [Bacteroidales bacterium]|nr:DUF4252 domain-containing protein [Bacteroidales bacterium]